MAINKLQLNTKINPSFKQQKEYKSYLEAENTITTENNVKPLPPKGHLVDDNLVSGTKYFFKDIGYDMKSVKEGYLGTANDHKLGRLNDVGLRLGGIGIAAYLASRTSDPKARIMEYVGLATFLTAMAIYPKIAINGPARILHGYDIDKEYIDDQGRKKSVQQDSNYVPYDMYQGQRKDEDIDLIGDKMGIPRDIKNRHDVIREQMRKIATQNNTLWMLTAGFATPLITALACCGLENYVIAPSVAKTRNKNANSQIEKMYTALKNMAEKNENLEANKLSKEIENILNAYRDGALPKEECENIIKKITKGLTDQTSKTIKTELEEILAGGEYSLEEIIKKAESAVPNKTRRKVLVPTEQELDNLIQAVRNDASGANKTELFRTKVQGLVSGKLQEAGLNGNVTDEKLVDVLTENFAKIKESPLTQDKITKVTEFAKIIGNFKDNEKALDACKHFKFEFAPETILARSSAKFEKTFLKGLGISYKELKKMSKDPDFARELLDSKLSELARNEAKFKDLMKKLATISAEMDINLNGANNEQAIRKLINGYEYLFNNTAERLENLGGFSRTIGTLVGNDRASGTLLVNDSKELFSFLDGTTITDLYKETIELGKQIGELRNAGNNAEADRIQEIINKKVEIINQIRSKKGAGSDKFNSIAKIVDRYYETSGNFNRIMHTVDTYKRLFTDKDVVNALLTKDSAEIEKVLEKCKETILKADANAHFTKLNTEGANKLYIDVMNALYRVNEGNKGEGIISSFSEDALRGINTTEGLTFTQRFKNYIGKFRYLIGNHKARFMDAHVLDNTTIEYNPYAATNTSKASLIAQNPVEFVQQAAGRKYNNQKWARIIGGILGGTLAVTLLAQFSFGRIRNPHNLQKQVNNDSNK